MGNKYQFDGDCPFEDFHRLIKDCNIPKKRLGNVKWIARNFESLNPDHPKVEEFRFLVRKLLFIKESSDA